MNQAILSGLLFVFLFPSWTGALSRPARDEVERYTLMHDRIIIDRSFFRQEHNSWLEFNLALSSGLKSLIGDVKEGTNSSVPAATRVSNVTELLLQHMNTEKLVDLNAEVGLPLPTIKHSGWKILPSFFYTADFGVSLSITNTGDATVPLAQTYVKKDVKTGLAARVKNTETPNREYYFALYQQKRSDLFVSLNALEIAQKNKIFDFSDLNREQVSWSSDLGVGIRNGKSSYLLEVKELLLIKKASDGTPVYGNRPFLHTRYCRTFAFPSLALEVMGGLHYRRRYSLVRGMYLALKKTTKDWVMPLTLVGKVSNQFVTLLGALKFRYFHAGYSVKIPHRNPQDNVWVPSMHEIHISIPFP